MLKKLPKWIRATLCLFSAAPVLIAGIIIGLIAVIIVSLGEVILSILGYDSFFGD